MTLTPRDIAILRLLRRYFYLRVTQIRDAVAPHDDDGSIIRGRMRKLAAAGLVKKYQPKLLDLNGSVAPVFVLSAKGSNILTAETGDASLLLHTEPNFADWMSLNHYSRLAALHMTIDAAVAAQDRVTLHALHFEHEMVQPNEADPSKKYRLHTVVSETPRLVCCPDSAFETGLNGFRRAWYVEREMGSDTPARVAAKKCKGYAGLAGAALFRRHFPQARDCRVLWFCPSAGWRDALRRELKDKPGHELHLFIASPDVTRDSILHGPIVYTIDRGPLPLVPSPAVRPELPPPGGKPAETRAEGA